jgi:hypothetical protein
MELPENLWMLSMQQNVFQWSTYTSGMGLDIIFLSGKMRKLTCFWSTIKKILLCKLKTVSKLD